MRNYCLVATLFLVLIHVSYGQEKAARKRVSALCSSEFHGRGYVNGGDSIAATFIASEFQRSGLLPSNGNFFQEYLFSVNTFPNNMSISVGNDTLIPGVDFIVDPESSGIHGIYSILRLDQKLLFDDSRYIQEVIKMMSDTTYILMIPYRKMEGDSLKRISRIAHELTAVAPVIFETDQKFTWSVGRRQLNHAYIEVRKDRISGDSLKMSIDAKLINQHLARNVIGYIPGRKKSKNVVFTAHYDHLGRMGRSTYFPGANDNASGTAMLMTMADYFAENKPKYDTYFIAFAGEEAGLIGSHYFVQHPAIDLNSIKALINLDIMGSGEEGITVVNGTENEKLFKRLTKINNKRDLLTAVKLRGPAANSDHYWFAEAGVPAIFIYTMGPNKHYHDVFDTYEELSFSAYERITTLLILLSTKI